jgi:hypothetical protein
MSLQLDLRNKKYAETVDQQEIEEVLNDTESVGYVTKKVVHGQACSYV